MGSVILFFKRLQRILVENTLFIVAVSIAVVVAVWGISSPQGLSASAGLVVDQAFGALGWFFLSSVSVFLGICLWMAFGRYGRVRLGRDDERPEFSTMSWLSMLFAAGMGVGILFWGVAEPMTHFVSPPVLEGGTPDAAAQALVLTSFHWGLHAWAVYALAALVLAYFGFRRGTPQLPGAPIRSAFRGRWVAPVAGLADGIGIVAVTIGVAGSIGMGVLQIHTGLHVVAGVPDGSIPVAIGIVIAMFVAYMLSATTGLDKGIRILSNLNVSVALLLMLFVLAVGPTASLLKGFVTGLGDYASSLVHLSLRGFPYRDLDDWFRSWTLTYFIWWIAWAPFVGVFIARISRGRTIREFVLGVLFVPSVVSVLWFSIFGGTAILGELHSAGGLSELVTVDVTRTLFAMFDGLPLSALLSWTAVLLVFIFLVTSADSATFVLGMLSSGGSLNPSTRQKLTWGITIGLLSTALILTRSIDPMRAVVATGAIPFVFVMLLQAVALIKALRAEDPPGGDRKGGAS